MITLPDDHVMLHYTFEFWLDQLLTPSGGEGFEESLEHVLSDRGLTEKNRDQDFELVSIFGVRHAGLDPS